MPIFSEQKGRIRLSGKFLNKKRLDRIGLNDNKNVPSKSKKNGGVGGKWTLIAHF